MAKTGPKRKYELDPKQLDEMYQRMSMRDIAAHFGCGETLIWARIKEFGIVHHNTDGNGRKRKRPPVTDEHRKNMGEARRGKYGGENAPRWRGGAAAANLRLRASGAYKQWKIASRKRAGNRCEECGIENGSTCPCCGTSIRLHCHHIKPFAQFPESRFDPENSEVLCPKCHTQRHNGKIG